MNSLKQRLNDYIAAQRGKVVPLNQIELLCRQWGYKSSNAERRLRPSDSPNIAPQYNEKHTAIIGYYYRQSSEVEKEFCCIENWRGQVHNPKCFKVKNLQKL